MENQNEKHLKTKFSHKDVEIFLKEKDKGKKEIIINEGINEYVKNDNKNDIKNINNINSKTSQNLIFHGTFGKEEYGRIMMKEHHHHHNGNLEEVHLSNNKEDKNKKGNIPLKC